MVENDLRYLNNNDRGFQTQIYQLDLNQDHWSIHHLVDWMMQVDAKMLGNRTLRFKETDSHLKA